MTLWEYRSPPVSVKGCLWAHKSSPVGVNGQRCSYCLSDPTRCQVEEVNQMDWIEFREQVRAIMRGEGDPDAAAAHDLVREVTERHDDGRPDMEEALRRLSAGRCRVCGALFESKSWCGDCIEMK